MDACWGPDTSIPIVAECARPRSWAENNFFFFKMGRVQIFDGSCEIVVRGIQTTSDGPAAGASGVVTIASSRILLQAD